MLILLWITQASPSGCLLVLLKRPSNRKTREQFLDVKHNDQRLPVHWQVWHLPANSSDREQLAVLATTKMRSRCSVLDDANSEGMTTCSTIVPFWLPSWKKDVFCGTANASLVTTSDSQMEAQNLHLLAQSGPLVTRLILCSKNSSLGWRFFFFRS